MNVNGYGAHQTTRTLIFNVKYLGNTGLDYNTGSHGTNINLHMSWAACTKSDKLTLHVVH